MSLVGFRRLQGLALCLALALTLAARPAAAGWLDLSQHEWSFVGEAGALFTPKLDTSGAHQPNATRDWDTTSATVRAEAWLKRPDALWLGIVAQPLDLTFRGHLTSNLDARGRHFEAGQPATLNFQFPSIRATANYPVWGNEWAELRLGASLIGRYAEQTLKSGDVRLKRTNTLVLPLLNVEATARLGGPWSAVLRTDLLPGENGTGVTDTFAGIRYALDGGRALELGGRTFAAGYKPDKSNDINSRVLFQSVVARFVF